MARRKSKRQEKLPARNQKPKLYDDQDGGCFYCGKHYESQKSLTRDHFFPIAIVGKGPAANKDNVVLACQKCNTTKADRLPTEEEIVRYVLLFGRLPYYLGLLYEARKFARCAAVQAADPDGSVEVSED